MKNVEKATKSSRKAIAKKGRVSAQPVKNDRYIYLIVDNTKELSGALNRLMRNSESQKDAVQKAILRAAK